MLLVLAMPIGTISCQTTRNDFVFARRAVHEGTCPWTAWGACLPIWHPGFAAAVHKARQCRCSLHQQDQYVRAASVLRLYRILDAKMAFAVFTNWWTHASLETSEVSKLWRMLRKLAGSLRRLGPAIVRLVARCRHVSPVKRRPRPAVESVCIRKPRGRLSYGPWCTLSR